MYVKDSVIPKVAPKTISKPSNKSNRRKKTDVSEIQRQKVNARERSRTSTMNQAFDNLKICTNLNKESSKLKVLEMANLYITFLHMVSVLISIILIVCSFY